MASSPTRPALMAVGLAAALIGASVLLTALYGPGYAGYDSAWSLVWGADIAAGTLPSYEAGFAPTPHVLANLVAAPVALLRDGGEGALSALTFLSFAALAGMSGVVAMRLVATVAGRRASGICAALAALLLMTNDTLAREAAFASLDLPFLLLVVSALALEIGSPQRGMVVLVLLALAGGLRPEAWGLALAYVAWIATRDRVRALRLTPLALAAPLAWTLTDLLVTGDPLWSLTGTRALSEELQRPTGLVTALQRVPSGLGHLMTTPALFAGTLALAALAAVVPRRLAVLAITGAVTLAAFLAFGAAGLPVLDRYLLIPACLLLIAAATAPALVIAALRRRDLRARAAAVLAACALLTLIPAAAQLPARLSDARSFTRARGDVQRDLRAIARSGPWLRAIERCGGARIPDFRTRPVALLDLPGADPDTLAIGNAADGEPVAILTYADERARFVFNLGAPGEVRTQAVPVPSRSIGANASWRAYANC